jgi:hypothetical protein
VLLLSISLMVSAFFAEPLCYYICFCVNSSF